MSILRRALTHLNVQVELVACSRQISTLPTICRWHQDKVENRNLRRFGYKDYVKMSGPLPRLSEDANRVNTLNVFTPFNPWAPKRALFGQNDYINILGDDPDAIKPHFRGYGGTIAPNILKMVHLLWCLFVSL